MRCQLSANSIGRWPLHRKDKLPKVLVAFIFRAGCREWFASSQEDGAAVVGEAVQMDVVRPGRADMPSLPAATCRESA
jgi:hypothetical protein